MTIANGTGRRGISLPNAFALVAILASAITLAVWTIMSGPSVKAAVVTVYCSADAPIAQPVFDAFEKKTGIKVRAVFDTEATKTTGLVNRLLDEHGRGHYGADVWWSSEPFGTIRLARAGVLKKYTSAPAESKFANASAAGEAPGGWPGSLRASDQTWYGFARRVRVLAYNTKLVKPVDLPTEIAGLADPKFRDRIAMARPEFGTTRGHMAAICALGEDVFRTWLTSVAANGLRLYEGNASVVRAVGSGEMWLGLTDSDDALIAQANGWPVGFVAIADVPSAVWHKRADGPLVREAPYPETAMEVPNTVALVRGGSDPDHAMMLIDFLLFREGESLLSKSESANLATPYPGLPISPDAFVAESGVGLDPLATHRLRLSELDLERTADRIEAAMKVCGEVLKGR